MGTSGERTLTRRHRDLVEWVTDERRLIRGGQVTAPAPPTRQSTRLLVVSLVLTVVLFCFLARLWWLAQPSGGPSPIDGFIVPLALFVLLLLLLSTIGWDRLHQRELADLRLRNAVALTATRTSGEARLAAMMGSTSDLVLVVAPDTRISYASASSRALLGRTPANLRGHRLFDLLTPGSADKLAAALTASAVGSHRLELDALHLDGHEVPVELTVTSHLDERAISGFVVSLRDTSELSRFTATLARQALLDPLTGLPNRRHFGSVVAERLRAESGERDAGSVAVVVLNVRDFKAVNTAHGHSVGDAILAALAGRLTTLCGQTCFIARVGGDEFGLLLERSAVAYAQTWVEWLIGELTAPLDVEPAPVRLGLVAGLAISEHQARADDLLQQADIALRAAKNDRVPVVRYRAAEHFKAIDRVALLHDLERAVHNRDLHLHFQTIIDLKTDAIHSLEVLSRWQHPQRGNVAPDEFIALAEHSGLMIELGDWILREACAAAARLQRPGRPVRLSVNVSALQLGRPEFVGDLLALLEEFGLDPGLLVLELTETALVVAMESVIPRLSALRSLGVHVAMDDFGTGYSSLHYLTRLPLDELKIDRSFVERLPWDPQTQSVVRGMLDMSASLGLVTVGEGIESEEQATWLRQAGCTLGQGFHFSRPVDEAIVELAITRAAGIPKQGGRRPLPA